MVSNYYLKGDGVPLLANHPFYHNNNIIIIVLVLAAWAQTLQILDS